MSVVRSAVADRVLTLTIDREERRNALSPEVLELLLEGVRDRAAAPDVSVVVVTGAGSTAFSAGADLAAFDPDATQLELHERRGGLRDLVLAIRACPRPVIARVQGLALAGGLGLVLACDLAVAADTAAFGLPEVDVGLWPFMVGALTARHVSPKRALDLMLTGRRIDAATAYEWGLVSRVVPASALDEAVAEVAGGIAGRSPLVLRLGKAAWYGTEEVALAPALEALQAQLSLLTQSKDAVEGVMAFHQKRPPTWTGR
ncbi:MAG TPA: enoyl-CoA hydratase-related protein [Mycobacteriales bacterium]|nr:enoyl-CoA hydratase-related protein [Mycobacteriales bacterium]